MAILGVSLSGGALGLAGSGASPGPALGAALQALPEGAPLVILIHGWRYDPADPRHDPHRLLFCPAPARRDRRLASWTSGLGFTPDGVEDGLCIGFGWPARAAHLPALLARGRTGFALVHDRAAEAGAALAGLIAEIAARAPGRAVDIVAHSLGARVALSALPLLDPGAGAALGRIILLGGAEFAGRAEAALARSAARPEVHSFTARHNRAFDALFETFAPRGPGADAVLSRRFPCDPGWITLRLDDPLFRRWAFRRGFALARPFPVCHWGFYTDPAALALYAALLRRREDWTLATLRSAPGPEAEARRRRIGPRLAALPRLSLPRLSLPRRGGA